ncbi:Tripartite-type tricarboxylate transporter, receptor component TctC [Polaromonas sp. YR568]|uniref:Bug family tripartite tricarboxylate transporter substrate binding protein n=1 Tax=Polaromonas sp. YR568 TaxID=1855301 RepID=UPI0008E19C4B|nr:tripartite tricarboxylate transporter substrate binding protein [Polaromonas sp. YR568]SFV03318.1 Tripartite-type tricarboxylate transporter, receptor component TctC [Polaromonas sp. YR568]
MTPVFRPEFKRPLGRTLAIAWLAAFTTTAVPIAHAQNFPTKPVRVVTPFPAGSGPEVALRLVADKLSKIWGQPVIVDNRPGASGFIAIEAIKRAAPDGHELLQMDNAQMAAQPFLFKKLPYDLLRDFEPVTPILRNYFFVTVPAGSRYKTMSDLMAAAKAGPGQVNYGSWFVGSPGHIGAAMLETSTATKMTHVPYKEMSQLYVAVGNQEVDWAFGSAASAGAMQRAGRTRYLAVAAPKRVAGFPDVPTVAESGGPAGFELSAWTALLAPKGTPKAVVEKIQKDVASVLSEQDVKNKYATMYYEPYFLNSEQFLQQLRSDSQRYGDTIKRLNISLD